MIYNTTLSAPSNLQMLALLLTFILFPYYSNATTPREKLVKKANKNGPYLGLVIPNMYEMNPLLHHPAYKPMANNLTTIDVAGRRFRFGTIGVEKVILVMTGLGMLNAGITTQLLLSLFDVKGVVHYGIAGNANPSLKVGDVAIPRLWSHAALWSWQRYGETGATNDYSREYGYMRFADYNEDDVSNCSSTGEKENELSSIWYQPEEIFPVDGAPEERQHLFWVPVDHTYFHLSSKLEGMELERCLNSTACLPTPPRVIRVDRGASASIFVDNAAYRSFLFSKFNVTVLEMESAAVALVCYQQRVPFITFRTLSDLAGGNSVRSANYGVFKVLAANNSVEVVVRFIMLLGGVRREK